MSLTCRHRQFCGLTDFVFIPGSAFSSASSRATSPFLSLSFLVLGGQNVESCLAGQYHVANVIPVLLVPVHSQGVSQHLPVRPLSCARRWAGLWGYQSVQWADCTDRS